MHYPKLEVYFDNQLERDWGAYTTRIKGTISQQIFK